jgi:lactoylglutathione lyase
VNDIYATCCSLDRPGEMLNRPPRDGRMAFIGTQISISIEPDQKHIAQVSPELRPPLPKSSEW